MVDIEKLKKLRNDTGVSFALCKKALEETDNDLAKAKKRITELAGKKIEEKSQRSTSQGGLFTYVHHNRKLAAYIELLSETDFVSGNDEFQKLGQELAMQAASVPANTVDEFLKTEYIRDPSKTVDTMLKEAIVKFGENIKLSRFQKLELGIS